ncbi:MAG: FkbM family methyltransferase [Candidatus Nealsonbacteria bacterium]
MKIIKRLTYSRKFRRLARFLHLSNILRKLYYYFLHPPDGILTLEVSGITAQFYIRTPGELRVLESMGGEQHILKLLIPRLRPGDVVYDIGGYVGLYTILLAKVVGQKGQVIAFEPQSQNFEHLLDNLKLNRLTNVRVFQKALGDREEKRKLYLGEGTWTASLVRPFKTETDYTLVELVKGDQFVKAENLSIPKAVKIDVGGYEYNMIKGLRRTLAHPACEIVCCEVHPPPVTSRNCF